MHEQTSKVQYSVENSIILCQIYYSKEATEKFQT